MITTISWTILLFFGLVQAKTIQVHNASELNDALKSVTAGDTINLQPGVYQGPLVISNRSGEIDKPITVTAADDVRLVANHVAEDCVSLHNSSYWEFYNLHLSLCHRGVVLQGSCENIFSKMVLTQTMAEGVVINQKSSGNIIINSKISFTGVGDNKTSKGVVIGTQITELANGTIDASDYNQVLGTHFTNIGEVMIEIMEGTLGGYIANNVFDEHKKNTSDHHQLSPEHWVVLKGDEFIVENNEGYSNKATTLRNPFVIANVHEAVPVLKKHHRLGGCNNLLRVHPIHHMVGINCIEFNTNCHQVSMVMNRTETKVHTTLATNDDCVNTIDMH